MGRRLIFVTLPGETLHLGERADMRQLSMPLLEKLLRINDAYDKKYDDVDPFRITTRLAEECGELAAQVNHFEGSGSKRQKLGEPSKQALAAEVIDVMRCALHLATYYEVMAEMETVAVSVLTQLEEEGWLSEKR